MTGSLVVLARQSPLNGGTTVPGAQMFVYEAGTTTKRTIYTTSALAVQHSNPVVADSSGRFAAVWLNPDSGSYKTVLAPSGDTDPPTSPFWTEDNIPVLGTGYSEGSFPVTFTGMGSATTGTFRFRIFANSAGVGKYCVLYADANILGTSNAATFTITGLTAAVTPSIAVTQICSAVDNTLPVAAQAVISASGTTITMRCDAPFDASGWTTSGSKGVNGGWSLGYPL